MKRIVFNQGKRNVADRVLGGGKDAQLSEMLRRVRHLKPEQHSYRLFDDLQRMFEVAVLVHAIALLHPFWCSYIEFKLN